MDIIGYFHTDRPWRNYQEIIIVLVTAVVIAAVVVIKLVNASESCYLRMEAKFV